ncbi:cupin domain-containing protein [Actinoplanes sp. NPDC051494]|uniref:cupin domain-containing protein n=1 Tax=Actinoplanes sp. NPDC051494 TaxID=3363907 RepID=UPI0037BAB3FA
MRILADATRFTSPTDGATHWVEHLRTADLSVGTYCVAAGGADDQTPHTEDEIYVVTAGRAVLEAGGARAEVTAGSVIFVPAGEEHRFTRITEDLALLVIFGPAEFTRTA